MKRYTAGYRLEHRVQQLYTNQGWLATRFPRSGRKLYPADVLALKRVGTTTHIHLIECKNASKENAGKRAIYIEAAQIRKLMDAAREHHALAIVAFSFPHQHARVIQATQLHSSGKMHSIEHGTGVLLSTFLQHF